MSHPYYGLNELREMFLKFFETKGHLRLPSFSLVPQNDKSILLINAGMTPMKPWFKGEEEPPCHRVCTCQKCIRTGDIDNVGKTARHGTYFEMLGNFSFGDYFKHEAIAWSWEFLTSPQWVGLEADRLYPSIYLDDDEAFNIWNKEIGIPAYLAELDERAGILRWLLEHCNDGRRKNFFCLAVNLLDLPQLHAAVKQLSAANAADTPLPERAAKAVSLLSRAAARQGILLKLRKRPKKTAGRPSEEGD